MGFFLSQMVVSEQCEDVEELASMAIAIDPSFTFAYYPLATVRMHQGKREQALAISNHSSGWCYIYRSLAYSDQGQSDEARHWLQRARKWNEDWAKGDQTFEWLKARAAKKIDSD